MTGNYNWVTREYNPLSREGWDNHKKPTANGKMFGRLAEVVVGLAATMPFVVVLVLLVATLLTLWP